MPEGAAPTVYRRNPAVLWRRTYDRVLVLVPGSDEVVTLAGTGIELWEAFGESTSVTQAAAALAGRYGAPTDVVANDIAPLVGDLVGMGILGTVPSDERTS